jgi:hypothetical protein
LPVPLHHVMQRTALNYHPSPPGPPNLSVLDRAVHPSTLVWPCSNNGLPGFIHQPSRTHPAIHLGMQIRRSPTHCCSPSSTHSPAFQLPPPPPLHHGHKQVQHLTSCRCLPQALPTIPPVQQLSYPALAAHSCTWTTSGGLGADPQLNSRPPPCLQAAVASPAAHPDSTTPSGLLHT